MKGKTNKKEVLQVIARILNLNDIDKQKIGVISKSNNSWSFIPIFSEKANNNNNNNGSNNNSNSQDNGDDKVIIIIILTINKIFI